MSRKFELFGDPAELEKLSSEYLNWAPKETQIAPIRLIFCAQKFLAIGLTIAQRGTSIVI